MEYLKLIVYTLGIIPAYLGVKYTLKSGMETDYIWTKRDRMIGIIFSFLSWIAFFSAIMAYIIINNDRKPSKW